MKIRPLITSLSIACLGLFGVSCKTTGTAGNTSNDGAYVGNGNSSGEYDNVYEMGGSDDDSYSYESADNSSSSYNYESNDYSSSPAPAPQPTYTPAPTQPTYTPAPTPTYTPAPAANRRHTVQRGDTLYNISKRYGTSVGAIQNANGLNGDLIRIDQTLMIP